MDYTEIEHYDCPNCTWSMHVGKQVWDQALPSLVIAYIEIELDKHEKRCGGRKAYISHPIIETQ